MVSAKQLRILATNPAAYARFQTTGQLPRGTRPQSPLITLLKALSPRDLSVVRGVTVNASLGYQGSRMFPFASQALRWVCPDDEVFGAFPAQSWQIAGFQKTLYLEDLAACCAEFPDRLFSAYPRLCRPPQNKT